MAPTKSRGAALRHEVSQQAMSMHRVDTDQDGLLNFEEFLNLFPPTTRARRPDSELRLLFDAIDIDGNGTIKGAEFFLYALRFAQKMLAGRLEDAFMKFDASGSGTLDKVEFAAVSDYCACRTARRSAL